MFFALIVPKNDVMANSNDQNLCHPEDKLQKFISGLPIVTVEAEYI